MTLESFVASHAPRPFALVEEGDGQDVQILGWGLDAGGSAYVVGYDGQMRGTFASASCAQSMFAHWAASVQVVWLRPSALPAPGPAAEPDAG